MCLYISKYKYTTYFKNEKKYNNEYILFYLGCFET